MSTRIQVRRDTAANWTSANPVLASGEQGLETDTHKFKYGDGATAWASLAYVTTAGAVASVNGHTGSVALTASDVGADASGTAAAEGVRALAAEALLLAAPTTHTWTSGPLLLGVNTIDATAGNKTPALPTPTIVGQLLSVEKTDATTNTVTISGTIRGSSTTVVLRLQNEAIVLEAESLSSWRPLADHKTLGSLDKRYQSLAPQSAITAIPQVLAHRGGGGGWDNGYEGPFPEETMSAFRASAAAGLGLGPHWQMLSDGALVCMHDQTVDRTTSGTGNAYDFDSASWSQLLVDPQTWAGYLENWGTINPPFADQLLREYGGKVFIQPEIAAFTPGPSAAVLAAAAVKLVTAYGLQNSMLLSSFSASYLTPIAAAGIQTMYLSPNFPGAGSDAATIASVMAGASGWATGTPKHVGINFNANTTLAGGATTSGSPTVTTTSAVMTTAFVGSRITGTGIPAGTYIGVINSTTSFGLSSSPTVNTPVNATATNSGLTLTVSPSQSAMTAYVQGLVSAGFTVWAYMVNRRYDMAWLLAAGASHFYSDDPIYTAATAPLVALGRPDSTAKGVFPSGVLVSDPNSASSTGRGAATANGLSLPLWSKTEFVCLGQFGPMDLTATRTIVDTFTFDTLPGDATRWMGVYLSTDDRPTTATVNDGRFGITDGYLLLVRANGNVQLFKQTNSSQASVQVGSTLTTVSLTTATSYTLTISRTSAGVWSITLKVGGTTYGPLATTDATFSPTYVQVGKSGDGTNPLACTHSIVVS